MKYITAVLVLSFICLPAFSSIEEPSSLDDLRSFVVEIQTEDKGKLIDPKTMLVLMGHESKSSILQENNIQLTGISDKYPVDTGIYYSVTILGFDDNKITASIKISENTLSDSHEGNLYLSESRHHIVKIQPEMRLSLGVVNKKKYYLTIRAE